MLVSSLARLVHTGGDTAVRVPYGEYQTMRARIVTAENQATIYKEKVRYYRFINHGSVL